MIVHEDNILSEEEHLAEEAGENGTHDEEKATHDIVGDETIVVDIDNGPSEGNPSESTRTYRTNAGAVVDRLHVDFHGKGEEANRVFHFVTKKVK